MKRIIVFAAVLLMAGCSAAVLPVEEPDEWGNLETIEDVMMWVNENICPKYDDANDDWQSPEETLELETGDCEDYAILMMHILHELFDIKSKLEVVFCVEDDGFYFHAVVRVEEMLYDPIFGRVGIKETWISLWSIGYHTTMALAGN